MKKTWLCVCLAALLTLPLAGCAGDRTGNHVGDMNASASPSATHSPSATPDLNDGRDDLAGSDGIVGGAGGDNGASGITDGNGAGNTGDDNAVDDLGRMGSSAIERAGEGIRDTLDDMGSAARRMGRDAKDAIEG